MSNGARKAIMPVRLCGRFVDDCYMVGSKTSHPVCGPTPKHPIGWQFSVTVAFEGSAALSRLRA